MYIFLPFFNSQDFSIWRSLLGYPVSRVSAYINSNDGSVDGMFHIVEEIVKKHKVDIEECTAVCDGLAKIALSVKQVF